MTLPQAQTTLYSTGNSDSALIGYLGDGKIYNSPILPDNAARPALTLIMQPFGGFGQNFSGVNYQLYWNLYLGNHGTTRQADMDVAHAIHTRLETIFKGQTLTNAGGRMQVDSFKETIVFTTEIDETVYQFIYYLTVL